MHTLMPGRKGKKYPCSDYPHPILFPGQANIVLGFFDNPHPLLLPSQANNFILGFFLLPPTPYSSLVKLTTSFLFFFFNYPHPILLPGQANNFVLGFYSTVSCTRSPQDKNTVSNHTFKQVNIRATPPPPNRRIKKLRNAQQKTACTPLPFSKRKTKPTSPNSSCL